MISREENEKKVWQCRDSYQTYLGESQVHYQFGHGGCYIRFCEIGQFVFAGFLKKYVPQKHLVQVNLREKLNFHDFYFQLRGAGYEDLTMIKSEIFYCIKISKKLSKIICFMQNHELLVFYCGHQSKVHRQKWVSTNRQLIVANLICITLATISVLGFQKFMTFLLLKLCKSQ